MCTLPLRVKWVRGCMERVYIGARTIDQAPHLGSCNSGPALERVTSADRAFASAAWRLLRVAVRAYEHAGRIRRMARIVRREAAAEGRTGRVCNFGRMVPSS